MPIAPSSVLVRLSWPESAKGLARYAHILDVIARLCGSNERLQSGDSIVLVHTDFDAQTVERMLNFIYVNDYDVTMDTSAGASNSTANSPIAHALTYAIASRYGLPDLKALSMTKFTSPETYIEASDFAELVETIYTSTAPPDDDMCKEIVAIAASRINELSTCSAFNEAIATNPELQCFLAELLPVLVHQFHNKVSRSNEQQNIMDTQRDKIAELRQAHATAEKDLSEKERELEASRVRCTAMQKEAETARSTLDMATFELHECQKSVEEANATIKRLRSTVSHEKTQNHELTEKIQALQEASKKEKTSHDTTSRETLSRLQDIESRVVSLQGEKDKMSRELLASKGLALKTEQALVAAIGKAFDVGDNAQDLLEEVDSCRNCGYQNTWWLEWDDSVAAEDSGIPRLMLRCGSCRCRHWGKKV